MANRNRNLRHFFMSKMRIPVIDIPCLGYPCGNPSDGYDYDCEYNESGCINCDDCVCNYGNYSPQTGKRINWLLRMIQHHRARRHYQEHREDFSSYEENNHGVQLF